MPTIVKWKYVKSLIAELQKPEYEGLDDWTAMLKLTAPTVTGNKLPKSVAVSDLVNLLFEREKLTPIKQAAAAGNAAAKRLIDWLETHGTDSGAQVNLHSNTAKKLIGALKKAGVFDDDDIAALRELSEEDEPGPSFAQSIGIGQVFPENIPFLRAYLESDDEAEIKYDLVGHLLRSIVERIWRVRPGVSAEEIMDSEAYKRKAALVADYTEVADAAVHKAVIEETLEVLRSGGAE